MSQDPYANYRPSAEQPRRRRSQRHDRGPAVQPAPQRPAYQPDDERAPLPLSPQSSLPPRREVPNTYDYDRYPPQNGEYDEDYDVPRLWPKLLALGLALILIVAALLYFLVPKDQGGIMGTLLGGVSTVVDGAMGLVGLKKEEAPKLIKFETPLQQSYTGIKTVFTFTADGPIDGVRMVDDQGTEVKGAQSAVDQERTVWTISVVFDQPMSGTLRAGMLRNETWYDSDKTISFAVSLPTPAPTLVPTIVPTLEPLPTLAPQADAVLPLATLAPLGEPVEDTVVEPVGEPVAEGFEVVEPAQDVSTPQLIIQTPAPAQQAVVAPVTVITPAPQEAPVAEAPMVEGLPDEIIDPADYYDPSQDEVISAEDVYVPDDLAPVELPATAEPLPVTQEPPPTSTPMPRLTLTAADKQAPKDLKLTETVYQKAKRVNELTRQTPINMPPPGADRGLYVNYDGGVFTFRNDAFRGNAAFGTADMPLKQMSVLWKAPLGSLRTADGTLYGLGWTGQPAIIKWAKDLRPMMNLVPEKRDVTALKEVIAAAQDGKVYFFDLNDGVATRDPIDVGYPLRGSVAVDTAGQPMIAFGQAASKLPGKTGPIGLHIYSLIDQKELYFLNGRKTKSQVQYSTNGAFDGTALFDYNTSSLIVGGENGLLYTIALNTKFDFLDTKTIAISPEITYLRSKGNQADMSVALEASVAMYDKYAYVVDRQGIMRAIDTDTMKAVWAFDTGDNTDATPALGFDEDGSLGLYTGTTVFTRTRRAGTALIRRLDALTGAELWKVEVPAKFDDKERGGVKASPIVGEKAISELVIFTVNNTSDGKTATMIALNKKTGAEVWRYELGSQSISSPVAVYTSAGDAYVIQADEKGLLTLLDGRTGSVLHTLDIEGSVEASPAVYNDVLVIGTKDKDNNFLYGIRLE